MEIVVLISKVSSLRNKKSATEVLSTLQQIFDLISINRMKQSLQYRIIWAIEAAKVASFLFTKYHAPPKEESESEQTRPSRIAAFREFARAFRSFFYILAIIVWGRQSLKPLAISLVLDLVSDSPRWTTYMLRYPFKDLLIAKVLPNFMGKILQGYGRHLSYIM